RTEQSAGDSPAVGRHGRICAPFRGEPTAGDVRVRWVSSGLLLEEPAPPRFDSGWSLIHCGQGLIATTMATRVARSGSFTLRAGSMPVRRSAGGHVHGEGLPGAEAQIDRLHEAGSAVVSERPV